LGVGGTDGWEICTGGIDVIEVFEPLGRGGGAGMLGMDLFPTGVIEMLDVCCVASVERRFGPGCGSANGDKMLLTEVFFPGGFELMGICGISFKRMFEVVGAGAEPRRVASSLYPDDLRVLPSDALFPGPPSVLFLTSISEAFLSTEILWIETALVGAFWEASATVGRVLGPGSGGTAGATNFSSSDIRPCWL